MGWTSFMAKTTTSLWDASEHLKSNEDRVAYLEAALADGDPALITAVLDDIARAKGMVQIAHDQSDEDSKWP
jgi:probable addiction module antidote protein